MIRRIAAVAAAALLPAAPVAAQPDDAAGQKLGQCMVLNTTSADRLVVARWLLGVLASAPQAADVVKLQPGKKEAGDRAMAALFTRLITRDCAADSKVLFARPGSSQAGFEVAGQALGGTAMREVMGSPVTVEAMGAYARYLDQNAFKGVMPAK